MLSAHCKGQVWLLYSALGGYSTVTDRRPRSSCHHAFMGWLTFGCRLGSIRV